MKNSSHIVSQMTLEEKASLCSGYDFWHTKSVERLGIPSTMTTDGPHGLRKQSGQTDYLGVFKSVPATCFPPACSTASSFDTDLLQKIGNAIGEECLQEQVGLILGPGANIKRSPLCGRNFEYISEDPYLSGKMAAALIMGVQEKGVGTSLKHFAANNQEKNRMTVDTVVDERTLREIYFTGFEIAVKEAQPWTVMGAYNRLNGIFACENKWLLTEVLRDEWGFEGAVVTDWGAANDRVEGVRAGLDLEMPASGGINDAKIVAAVKNRTLDEADLDKVVTRMVDFALKAQAAQKENYKYDVDAHHTLARCAAAASCVLLKNETAILPLTKEKTVAAIGAFAKNPRYQGAGSSKIKPTRLDNAFDALLTEGFDVTFAEGYSLEPGSKADNALIAEACSLAKEKDVAVVFVGLPDEYESEGFDRQSLYMPESHTRLVEEVAKANSNTVVVLMLGAPIVLPWESNVKGIVLTYLGGQAGGSGCVDVLSGAYCPSGKLTESWPLSLMETPCYNWYPGLGKTAEYRESIFVGYRYYDTMGKDVAYPFGYGLSYTSFEYSNIKLSSEVWAPGQKLQVSFTVTNIGSRPGGEVAQLYLGKKSSKIMRAKHEFKGFCKVHLQPGESKEVTLSLDDRSFAYYNAPAADWAVEDGEYCIEIGASSRDIRLLSHVEVQGDGRESLLTHLFDASAYYTLSENGFQVSQKAFEALLGHPAPLKNRLPGEKYDTNSTLGDMQNTLIGKQIIKQVRKQAGDMIGKQDNDIKNMMKAMLLEMPLRALAMMSNGAFTYEMMEGVINMLNGKPLKGLGALLGNNKKGSD